MKHRRLAVTQIFLGCLMVGGTTIALGQVHRATGQAVSSAPITAEPATIVVVNSPANDGPGTLRQALQDAQPGTVITFDPLVFPPTSPVTITVTSGDLPHLDDGGVTVDASGAGVILDGSALSGWLHGLYITSAGNRVYGLQIVHFPAAGIWIAGADNVIGGPSAAQRNVLSANDVGVALGEGATRSMVQGNYIGVDATGSVACGNAHHGVEINWGASHNLIGGPSPAQRNVVSANGEFGVGLWGADTSYNIIQGNYIGTDASGLSALGNNRAGVTMNGAQFNQVLANLVSGNEVGIEFCCPSHHNVIAGNLIGVAVDGNSALPNETTGVRIWGGASFTLIGGLNSAARNVISGNNGWGIEILQPGTVHNSVVGNYVGVAANGTVALPNGNGGISIAQGATYNTVGGWFSPARNLISGNNNAGISLDGLGTSFNQVLGNVIGVDATGGAPLPNASSGVIATGGATNNVIGPDNLIAMNSGAGVWVRDATTLRNTITQNSLFGNAGRGIELAFGGNGELSAPHVLSANLATGEVTGAACPVCVVEVFSSADEEGQVYEGTGTADSSGAWSLLAGHPLVGPEIHATATDPAGNTSPFSCPIPDVNCDGQVNELDLTQVAAAWGCAVGDACYLPWLDQNQDAVINIVDVMQVARHWGQ